MLCLQGFLEAKMTLKGLLDAIWKHYAHKYVKKCKGQIKDGHMENSSEG